MKLGFWTRLWNSVYLYIERDNIFEDAYNWISDLSPESLKKGIKITFLGELGIDVGGLTCEFFNLLSKEIGNINYLLFKYSNENSYKLEINPESRTVNNYLKYYKFISRILGMSIFYSQNLSVLFTNVFYKRLLGKDLHLSDLEYIDPELFRNLTWLKK